MSQYSVSVHSGFCKHTCPSATRVQRQKPVANTSKMASCLIIYIYIDIYMYTNDHGGDRYAPSGARVLHGEIGRGPACTAKAGKQRHARKKHSTTAQHCRQPYAYTTNRQHHSQSGASNQRRWCLDLSLDVTSREKLQMDGSLTSTDAWCRDILARTARTQ